MAVLSRWKGGLIVLASVCLESCGGGDGGSPTPTAPAPIPPTAIEASRFLTQATFGPSDGTIAQVQSKGYAAWIDSQITMPSSGSHQAFVDARLTALKAQNPNSQLTPTEFYESFWAQAAVGDDQLRQRMKLALSEIFVISFTDPNVDVRGAASYYDMLGQNALGNYRTLLEQVSLHPMMGLYLTDLANQKEDASTGRHPDENYAREVMQLMSIGLFQLNQDGSRRLDTAGNPISSYTPDDVSGLAKVFTGLSYYSPAPNNSTTFFGKNKDPDANVRPMIAYPIYHSTSAKTFLGVTIAASATPDPGGDLKVALDTIFNHPNTPPFVSKQLIQRLVTSNPSPAYVSRVAAVFINNGQGVRGDLGAAVKAILMDSEARDIAVANNPAFGKLREPVVRMANWMHAFGATSQSGSWLIGATSPNTSLSQSALNAPSVFNFWRPGYSPTNSTIGAQNLLAPEFQVVDEVSTAGYLNTMLATTNAGIGSQPPGGSGADVQSAYTNEIAVAGDANALVDRMNLLLMSGQMSATLRGKIVDAVTSAALPGASATQPQINAALLNRAKLATFMTMASAEYLAQR